MTGTMIGSGSRRAIRIEVAVTFLWSNSFGGPYKAIVVTIVLLSPGGP